MSRKKQRLMASMEAIDFQDGKLFEELTEAISAFRKEGKFTDKAMKASNISDIIQKHTNLNITVRVDPDLQPNAFTFPPMIDKNNPVITESHKFMMSRKDAVSLMKKAKGGGIIGGVDLKNAKVEGVFKEVKVEAYFTRGALSMKMLADDELAAIMLHEVGHIFTYFEFLGHSLTTNYALTSVVEEVMKTKEKKKRVAIFKTMEKAFDFDIDDPQGLAEWENADAIRTVVLNASQQKHRSRLGSEAYDVRGWEYLADQFAARQGAGRAIATGLDKLFRSFGSPSHISRSTFYLIEVTKVLLLVLLSLLSGGLFILFWLLAVTVLFDPNFDLYDDPRYRLERVRHQIIQELKNKNESGFSEIKRDRLIDDQNAIERLLDDVEDRQTLTQYLANLVLPWNKREKRQIDLQKELEQLAHNKLFVHSAELERRIS